MVEFKEFDINALPVVFGKLHPVAEDLGTVEDVAFVEVVKNFKEFVVGKLNIVVFFEL
jgi:hypothetical protein